MYCVSPTWNSRSPTWQPHASSTLTSWDCTCPTKTTTKSICVHRKSSSTTTCCSKRALLLPLEHSLTVSVPQKTSTKPKHSTKNSAAVPNVAKMALLKASAIRSVLKIHWASHTSSSTTSTTLNVLHGASTCMYQVHWSAWTTSTRSLPMCHALPPTCKILASASPKKSPTVRPSTLHGCAASQPFTTPP